MISLNWDQVNTWRLAQHHLLQREDRQQMLDVVSQIGGLQAQVMSAAELQLWARIQNLLTTDVRDALWLERTLIKTWALRGTLHLLVTKDFPLYVAALSTRQQFRRGSWLKYHGVTLDELQAIIVGVHATLHSTGMTREQLADAIAKHANVLHLRDLLRSGWGALLKPAAFQGYLCFGPSEGQNVTFVQPDQWIGEWTPIEPDEALKELVRRYLTAYGPATLEDFGHWLGMEPSVARRIFRSISDEIEEVDVEGWKAWALCSSVGRMNTLKSAHSVCLLPNFDSYTIAVSRHSQYLLSEAHKARVYRPQGWISPVVLVNGRMEGVWEYDKQHAQTIVTVNLFAPLAEEIQQAIEAEAKRLGKFLNTNVQTIYA